MSLLDTLTVVAVIVVWAAVFVPLFMDAYRQRCKLAVERDEVIARLAPRLKVALPLFWVSAGVITGYLADHPIPVAAAFLFVRLLFFLVGGRKAVHVGTFFLHAVEFSAGTALGLWLHTVAGR